jgi:hypothetical protein
MLLPSESLKVLMSQIGHSRRSGFLRFRGIADINF